MQSNIGKHKNGACGAVGGPTHVAFPGPQGKPEAAWRGTWALHMVWKKVSESEIFPRLLSFWEVFTSALRELRTFHQWTEPVEGSFSDEGAGGRQVRWDSSVLEAQRSFKSSNRKRPLFCP